MEAGRDTERGEGEGMGMRKGSGKSSSEVATLGFQVAWLREEESGERQEKRRGRRSHSTESHSINRDSPGSCGPSLHSSGVLTRTNTAPLVIHCHTRSDWSQPSSLLTSRKMRLRKNHLTFPVSKAWAVAES